MMYLIQSIGVRSCRRRPAGAERTRDGRLQMRIEVSFDQAGICWGRPQWVDAALVFIDKDEARDLYRRARKIAHHLTIAEAAVSLAVWGAAR